MLWARMPDKISPRSCAKNTTDITVLDTRPISACGVSCCINVCAGTMMPANANPMVNMAKSAAGTYGSAPRSSAPTPMPDNPASTITSFDARRATERSPCVPTSRPTPTIALTVPNTPELACSHSRT